MKTIELLKVLNAILLVGEDDYFFYGDIQGCCVEVFGNVFEDNEMDLIIKLLLDHDYVVIGDLENNGFKEWSVTSESAISTIQERRSVLCIDDPSLDVICWFNITDLGGQKAGKLIVSDIE